MIVRNITSSENIDNRTVLCKALTAAKTYFGDRYFTRRHLMFILIKTVKLKKPTSYTKKYSSPESISRDQAYQMFDKLLEKGYIEYSHIYKATVAAGNTLKIAPGEKMYKINPLGFAECTETAWYKNRQRKEKYILKEGSIDKRSCRALQQIYVMFGQMPFSYNTVTETSRMVLELSTKKGFTKTNGDRVEFTPAEKTALEHMKTKLYGYEKNSFRSVWNSLLRTGALVPHKIKTADGYIKKTGLYKINQPYLKYCLAELL